MMRIAASLWPLGLALAAPLPAQQGTVAMLVARVGDARIDPDLRGAAMCALQDRSALDVELVLQTMTDPVPGLGLLAASIVRHEWIELPAPLLAGLDERPAAAALLLRELAVAPRPAAAAWARRWASRPGVSNDVRCLAFCATGSEMNTADSGIVLAALTEPAVDDGFHMVASLLPAAVADGLLGKMHQLLLAQKAELGRLLPIVARLSPAGDTRLLGLVVTLPPAVAETLCLHLVARESPAYTERARAALDGEIPLDPLWLLRAGPLLQDPARRERLLAVLSSKTADPLLQARAFAALADAGVVEDRLLDFAQQDANERLSRLRRVLDVGVASVPETRLVEWLDADPPLAALVADAALRRPVLGGRLERALVDLVTNAGIVEGALLQSASRALLRLGDAASVARIWPELRTSPACVEWIEALSRRRAPFVAELLLEELQSRDDPAATPQARERQLDAVRLALCVQGDRRQQSELIKHARNATPEFVRRCRHHVLSLSKPDSLRLLDEAATVPDDDLAAEMIGWASVHDSPDVMRRLVDLWQAPEVTPRQEVALRTVVAGPMRARLQQELQRAAAAGPLVDRYEQLAYEVIASLPQPLASADATLLAELALQAPLADADGEAARAQRWPDGRSGFPLVAAIAQQLRGSDPDCVGEAFAGVAARVAVDARVGALARQRLLVMWRSLAEEPRLQSAVGRATARLLLAIPHAGSLGAGPAHWYLAQSAQATGELQAAAEHARIAIAELLRLPSQRRTARLFLGEHHPAAGEDPWAALSALPHLLAARSALAAGEITVARRSLGLAREFAGRDAATLTSIENLTKEIHR